MIMVIGNIFGREDLRVNGGYLCVYVYVFRFVFIYKNEGL